MGKVYETIVPTELVDTLPALVTVYHIKTGKYLYVNGAIKEILGYTPETFIDKGVAYAATLIHPDDTDRIAQENMAALEVVKKTGKLPIVNFEYRMRHKNGSYRWLHTDGSVFTKDKKGNVESVMNISIDISARKIQELKAQDELVTSDARYKTFLSQSSEGIWRFELDRPISIRLSVREQIRLFYKYAYLAECNEALAKMYGFGHASDIVGVRLGDFLPKDDPSNIDYLTNFIRSGYKLERAISHEIDKDGAPKIFENNLIGIVENSYILRAWGTQRNVTQEKILQERLAFLESMSRVLVVSLDQTIALQEITKLIVPHFADYCRIVTIHSDGSVSEIAANHRDPGKVTLVHDLYERYKNIPDAGYGIQHLLTTGKPELISKIDDNFLKPYRKNKQVMDVIQKIGLKSYMGFPLVARGKILGAVTFSSIKEHRYYTEEDLQFAQIVVFRLALQLDNFRLYSDAQKAIAVRDNFISVASHELKTPLTSLKIYTELLEKDHNEGKIPDLSFSSRMTTQVNKLTYLVGDLLDISKISTGKLKFSMHRFSLRSCIAEVVKEYGNLDHTHEIVIRGNVTRLVYADKNRIEQVLINLLSNAVKYSPRAKKVIIDITTSKEYAVVRIEDFGIGIDKRHQHKIFEKFYRVDTDQQHTYPGLGIGLFLSKEIIERHAGTLWVKSKKGKGSVFSFSLPYKKPKLQT